tara:strand:+ start:78507 stop:79409 length:903 start_codon:yes stop_codon:yes gene_type:complete
MSFRVSSNTFPESLKNNLARLNQEQSKLLLQATTGQRITKPSDDAPAMARILDYQSGKREVAQFSRNANRAHIMTQSSYNALDKMRDISTHAQEIGASTNNELAAEKFAPYAKEVDGMLEQAVNLLNSKHLGDSLFAGNQSDVQPFQVTRDVNNKITAITYNGATTASAKYDVAENTNLSPVLDGSEAQGLLSSLDNLRLLRDALEASDSTAVAALEPSLRADGDKVIASLGTLGAKLTRIEGAKTQNSTRFADIDKSISNEADVDFVSTIQKLNQVQMGLQTAMQAGARALSLSILDFI